MFSWTKQTFTSYLSKLRGSKSQLYAAISDSESKITQTSDENSNFEESLPSQQKFGLGRLLVLSVLGVIFLSELFFVIFFQIHWQQSHEDRHASPPSPPSTIKPMTLRQCGNSMESARSLNCVFDYLTMSWEAPGCYHQDIVSEFLQLRDWDYYVDTNGTSVSSWEDVVSGSRRYNVRWDWHFTHCIYGWKMMQRAVFERRTMPDNVLVEEHTRHCMDVLLDRRWDFEELHTLIHVKWPRCMPYSEWALADYQE